MREAKCTLVIIQKQSVIGILIFRPKIGPHSRKTFNFFFWKNGDLYPKDFKFSGYEGLIHKKFAPDNWKSKRYALDYSGSAN